MPALAALAIALQLAVVQPPAPAAAHGPLRQLPLHLARPTVAATDTLRKARPRAVEYSDWYARRATIHKVSSLTMLPLFAAQYYTGTRLLDEGSDAPDLVRKLHGPLATGVAGLFGVNTVTGIWNLWEGRGDPDDRTRRVIHGLLMLTADAGFVATGMLADEAEGSGDARDRHRTMAIASMSVAAVGYLVMLPPLRRD